MSSSKNQSINYSFYGSYFSTAPSPAQLSTEASAKMSGAAVAIAGTLGGCMSCMTVVEGLARLHPDAMNLMTFSNFLFIALHGLVFTSRFLSVPNKIPIRAYVPVVLVFCFVNVINNMALSFRVPVPLHIIFRSVSCFLCRSGNLFCVFRARF